MTFIIALQADDSIIVSADNKLLLSSKDQGIDKKDISANKIHCWSDGILTGVGEYCIIYRMLGHLRNNVSLSRLPLLLNREKEYRRCEVGDCEQIDITQLIISTAISPKPQLYIVNSFSVESISPGEVLMFFPMGYDFLSASAHAIEDLHSSVKNKSDFPSCSAWMGFYMDKFSEIYAVQNKSNELISRSYHVCFQSLSSSQTHFVPNIPNQA